MDSVPSRPARAGGPRVLVAYATVHGSTGSIAERIAARLAEQGADPTVRPVAEVTDPSGYDAYVVGSAVHDMAWLPPALAFVHAHAELLRRRGVWIFSVGMPGAMRGPWKALAAGEERQVAGELVDELRARGHRLFSGVIEPGHLTRGGRVRMRVMGLRYGDYRDWSAVDGWAREIGRDLLGRTA